MNDTDSFGHDPIIFFFFFFLLTSNFKWLKALDVVTGRLALGGRFLILYGLLCVCMGVWVNNLAPQGQGR